MNAEQALFELLDNYAKGRLSAEEASAVEERMTHDAAFRKTAEEHLALLGSLKFYGTRNQLHEVLEATHFEMEAPGPVAPPLKLTPGWKKYWPLTAVAASVAMISILGTLFMTRSLETQQKAYYKELRRNVDQIRQSQQKMMQNIEETKEKEKALPGRYAGTGFLISANGYIATSYHVVKEADSVYIENEKFGARKARIVHSDPANDISILKIVPEDTAFVKMLPFIVSKTEASLAEDVYTLGFPREDVVFGEGAVSALSGYKQNPNAYQVSVPVNPGNSGGPLLNSKGDLIGMISGLQTETQGAAFAIKSTVILDVIDNVEPDTLQLQTPLLLPKQNTLKNAQRVQQVKKWKDYVFMVKVYKN